MTKSLSEQQIAVSNSLRAPNAIVQIELFEMLIIT